MQIIADLHLHSKFSRATSPLMDVDNLSLWAKKKGIGILTTGDFTHPKYLKELKEKLLEDNTGLLKLKDKSLKIKVKDVFFILGTEISCIYKDKGKVRRLHILVYAPDFATVDKINAELIKRKCNLSSDGRPIIGLSAKQLAQICFEANPKCLVVPAHAWTPWFAVFGSKSGYDSLQDCFEELTPNIFAIETGLSSDPQMNWRLSALDNILLISNSDAHNPRNLGREANVFDLNEFTYDEIYNIFKNKDHKKFLYTVEFFPQEGKYHYDGHLNCHFVCSPQENKIKYKNICPVCKKTMTLGVDHRVDDLADRELGFVPKNSVPYKNLVPLEELLAQCLGVGKSSKTVASLYESMLGRGGNEFNILLNLDENEITEISNNLVAKAIKRVRLKQVCAIAGYDGQYGVIKVFSDKELDECLPRQKTLI